MNKKKKITRIKHRKNRNRVKKINQVSLLKAKPKKNVATPIDNSAVIEPKIKSSTTEKKSRSIFSKIKKLASKKSK